MKKILSILLSVLLLFSTVTVLTALPAVATTPTESAPVNLIVNGDFSGIDTDGDGVKDKTVYTAEDEANSLYAGEFKANRPVGWRVLTAQYCNAELRKPAEFTHVNSGYFTNYNGVVAAINQGQVMVQDIKLGVGKTYKISAKFAYNPTTTDISAQTAWAMDMYLDAETEINATTRPTTDKDWRALKKFTFSSYNLYEADGATVKGTYYGSGDFTDHSMTFNADDFATENNLTAVDGYYSARLVIYNYSWGGSFSGLVDDVSMYEICSITAGDGGYVDTETVYANVTSTITATPYYGNGFMGWYNGDELISTNATYTGVITSDLTAKFIVYNQFVDGGFESGTTVGVTQFTSAPRYSAVAINPTIERTTNTIENSTLGDYCIEINPASAAASHPQLLNLPVTVEKNKQYIFEYYIYHIDSTTEEPSFYSYFSPKFGSRDWNKSSCDLLKSYTFTYALESIDTNANVYSWYGTKQANNTSLNINPNAVDIEGNWIRARFIFETGESADIFGTEDSATFNLQIGLQNNANYDIRLDNIFFGEASSTVNITATEGGTVSNNLRPMYYKSTGYGEALATTDYDTKYYPHMATEHTATADGGYRFLGWYDADDKLVSTNTTELLYTGNVYTAKFEEVPSYTITAAAEKNADGIYGGYVVEDYKSQTITEGENVTVSAVTYAGNSFDGWYNGDTKVSADEAYTFAVSQNLDLVAKWNISNLWPDSGYENTDTSLNQMTHHNINGQWSSFKSPVGWSNAYATNAYANSGSASMGVTHRQNDFGTYVDVESNTDYEFSFNWLLGNSKLENSDDPSYLNYVAVYNENDGMLGYWELNTLYSEVFQNTKLVFNSGDNSKVYFVFNYYAGSQPMYFDDVYLVPFDSEAGTTDYYRVTYDFGNEVMAPASEYVKSGEYTLRDSAFFGRKPAGKKFDSYTVNEETKAVGDIITVDSDVTVYMNYYDYNDSKLSDSTTFDPADYEFTFAALPDQQKLLVSYPDYYDMIAKWLLANKETYKIDGILNLGDITEYGSWSQWSAAYDAYKDVIAAMPFGVSLGNHDYPGGNSAGTWTAAYYSTEYNTSVYNHFFKDAIVESLLANNGGAYPYVNKAIDGYTVMSADAEVANVDNTYYVYDNGYIVISLEIFPRTDVLNWADAIIKANTDKKIIVTTHSHIDETGALTTDSDYYAIAANDSTNGAATVRETLLANNSNVAMLICGHESNSTTVYNEHTREDGSVYYEVLLDNQNDDINSLGVGNVTLLGFKADGTVDLTTYSTVQQKYFIPESNELTLDFNIPSVSNVAENVAEGATIDTSIISKNYFIPYGSVYYTENGEIKFVDKNEDGSFTAPVAGEFNFTGFLKPEGKLTTYGASANKNDGTVQYGSYVPTVEEGTTYGTMFITGDWETFRDYYMAKGWSVETILSKVSAMYDSKIDASTTGNVAIKAGDTYVFVYKVNQKNYMYKNDSGILEYALRVVGLAEDRTCTAVGYAKTEIGCEFSENIVSTTYNTLLGIN